MLKLESLIVNSFCRRIPPHSPKRHRCQEFLFRTFIMLYINTEPRKLWRPLQHRKRIKFSQRAAIFDFKLFKEYSVSLYDASTVSGFKWQEDWRIMNWKGFGRIRSCHNWSRLLHKNFSNTKEQSYEMLGQDSRCLIILHVDWHV